MVHSSRQMLVKTKHCILSRLKFVGMYCCLKYLLNSCFNLLPYVS